MPVSVSGEAMLVVPLPVPRPVPMVGTSIYHGI